jgi:ankyrin repeat protein
MRQGGCTPLHDAVLTQDIASALALLEGGADINAQNTMSAWQIAATFIALNVWRELIVDVVQFGQTPLMIAAMTENIPLMFVLHAAGARVDLRDKVCSVQILGIFQLLLHVCVCPIVATERKDCRRLPSVGDPGAQRR